jgi:hypothetical protein
MVFRAGCTPHHLHATERRAVFSVEEKDHGIQKRTSSRMTHAASPLDDLPFNQLKSS